MASQSAQFPAGCCRTQGIDFRRIRRRVFAVECDAAPVGARNQIFVGDSSLQTVSTDPRCRFAAGRPDWPGLRRQEDGDRRVVGHVPAAATSPADYRVRRA